MASGVQRDSHEIAPSRDDRRRKEAERNVRGGRHGDAIRTCRHVRATGFFTEIKSK